MKMKSKSKLKMKIKAKVKMTEFSPTREASLKKKAERAANFSLVSAIFA